MARRPCHPRQRTGLAGPRRRPDIRWRTDRGGVGGQGGGLLEQALASREFGRTAVPSGTWLARAVADPALVGEPTLRQAMIEQGDFTALAVRCDRIPTIPTGMQWDDGHLSGEVP